MPVQRRSVKGSEDNWVETQCAVFKNWVNQNLMTREMELEQFETGFADGIKLINLYEVVAKKKLGRYTKKPKLPNQMLENVTLALKAMEGDGINLLSIDSEHIVNGSLKLILGLIWRMILHYQIGAMTVKIPVKKLILIWVKNVIPDQGITNLTQDWNSGRALCALIEALKPGSCPNYNELKLDESVENCRLGLRLAKEKANIPSVVTAEQMADPKIDEQSMITYLSYFIQGDGLGEEYAKHTIASWCPELTFSNFNTDWNDGIRLCTLVEALSPGSIPNYQSLDPANKIENITLGMNTAESKMGVTKLIKPEDMANPEVTEIVVMAYLLQFRKQAPINPSPKPVKLISVTEEEREEEPVIVLNHEPVFEPEPEPEPVVQVESEIVVEAENLVESVPEEPEPPKVTADLFMISGTGLTDPQLDLLNEFYVRCEMEFDIDSLQVKVTGPGLNAGDDDRDMPVQLEKTNNSLVTCRYPLDSAGLYTVDVTYDGEHVHRSPVSIKIVQDLTRVTVSGSGLGQVFLHEPAELKLETGLENAVIHAYTISSQSDQLPAVVSNLGGGDFVVKYVPHHTGLYGLYININGENLPGSPYVSKVFDPSTLVVSSLQQKEDKQLYASPDQPVSLTVDVSQCDNDYGAISATTTGPHHSDIQTEMTENDDGTLSLSFTPTTVGFYHTDILWNKRKVTGSPFSVLVSDPGKCVAHGEGLYQARLNEAACFEVSTIGVGPGTLTATADCNGEDMPIELTKVDENTYKGSFYPDSLNQINVNAAFNGVPIRGSPFVVNIGNPSRCKYEMVDRRPVKVDDEKSIFVTFDEEAGHGEVSCIVKGPTGEVPVMIIDTGKNSKRIDFRPKTPGMHEVKVMFAEAMLAGCPHMIEVFGASDPSKVVASGDGLHEAQVNEMTIAHVDCRAAGEGKLTASVIAEDANCVAPVAVRKNEEGLYDVTYSVPKPDTYLLDIKYDNEHIPGSPFTVKGQSKVDPTQVVLSGNGLKEGTTGQPVQFTLDGRNAGDGKLACHCKSPSNKETYVLISDNKDGTFTVDLNASEPGVHSVELEWDGKPVPGSPFLVRIMQAPDASKVRVSGPGLSNGLLGEYEAQFSVDTKGAGPGTLKVRIHGPKGAFKVEMFRENQKDRCIGVRYSPKEPGQYTINVLWSGEPAGGSPFEIYLAENKHQLENLIAEAKRLSINGYNDKKV